VAKRRDRKAEGEIVLERVKRLFDLAEREGVEGEVEKASALAESALKLSARYNTPLPAEYRRRICKHCKAYLTSANSRRRLNPRHRRVEVLCLECNRRTFHPYRRGKKD
jgi:ribonuclease P protein subunit RPR2